MSITFVDVEKLAEAITGTDLTVENDTVVLNKDVYYGNLPEGLTKEQADAVHAYDASFLAATGLAAGQIANEHFQQNPECESVSLVAPLDHMEVSHRVYEGYQIEDTVHNSYIVSSAQIHTRGLEEDIIGRMQEAVAGMYVPASTEEEAA